MSARTRTVRSVLSRTYAIDAADRGYAWSRSQVDALLRDLVAAYRPPVGRPGRKSYYLGALLLRQGALLDGRQRLLTLSLLFVALRRQLADGRKSVRDALILMQETCLTRTPIDAPFADEARGRAVEELDRYGEVRTTPDGEVQRAIAARYAQIAAFLSETLTDDLAGFSRWLLSRVRVAEIQIAASCDPHAVFDGVNARAQPCDGLARLGAFVAERAARDPARRADAHAAFDAALAPVAKLGPDAEAAFLRAWLAARTLTIEGASPTSAREAEARLAAAMADIDREGAFWPVRNADHESLGLRDAAAFLDGPWRTLCAAYARARQARVAFDPGLPGLFFVGRLGFDFDGFEDALLLACVDPDDAGALSRMAPGAQFLEAVTARLVWSEGPVLKPATRARMKLLFAQTAGRVRGRSAEEVGAILADILEALPDAFAAASEPVLKGLTGPAARHTLLARLASFMDERAGRGQTYPRYELGSAVFPLLPTAPSEASALAGHTLQKPKHYLKEARRFCAFGLLDAAEARAMAERPYREKRELLAFAEVNLLVRSLFGPDLLPADLQDFGFRNVEIISRDALDDRAAALVALAQAAWSADRIRSAAGRVALRVEAREDAVAA